MSTNIDEVKYQLDAPAVDAVSGCLTTENLDSKRAHEFIDEALEKLKNLSQVCAEFSMDLTNYREAGDVKEILWALLNTKKSMFQTLALSLTIKDQTEAELKSIGACMEEMRNFMPVKLSVHIVVAKNSDAAFVFMREIHPSLTYALELSMDDNAKNGVEFIRNCALLKTNKQIIKLKLTQSILPNINAAQLGDIVEMLLRELNLTSLNLNIDLIQCNLKEFVRIAEMCFANTTLTDFNFMSGWCLLDAYSAAEQFGLATAEVMLNYKLRVNNTHFWPKIFDEKWFSAKVDLLKVVENFLAENPVGITCLKSWLSAPENTFLQGLKEETILCVARKFLAEYTTNAVTYVINLCDQYPTLRDVVLEFVEAHPEQLGFLNTPVFTSPLITDSALRTREQNRIEKIAVASLQMPATNRTEVLRLCEFYPNTIGLKFLHEELAGLEKLCTDSSGCYSGLVIDLTNYRKSTEVISKLNHLLQQQKTTFNELHFLIMINIQSEMELADLATLVNGFYTTKRPVSLIITVPNRPQDRDKLFNFMCLVHKSIMFSCKVTCASVDNSLGNNKIDAVHFIDFIEKISADKRILRLHLDSNQLSNFGAGVLHKGLNHLAENASLRLLTLKNNGLVKFGFDFINALLEKFGHKTNVEIGGSDTSIEDFATVLNAWTHSERERFFTLQLKSYLKRSVIQSVSTAISSSGQIFGLKNWFSEVEIKKIIMECFDETPEALPELYDLVTNNPCLRDLDSEWIKNAARKFLKSFAYNNDSALNRLRELFPCLQENNSELNSFLSVLESRADIAGFEKIKLSLISMTEDNLQESTDLLNRILMLMKYPKGIIELDKQTSRELELLASMVNQLKFPTGTTLQVVEQQRSTHGLTRVALFFKLLNNPSMNNYSFVGNNLTASDEKSFFEILEALSKKEGLRIVDLSNNRLNVFTSETLFEGLQLLAHCHAKEIDLSNNELHFLGVDFMLRVKHAFQNRTFVRWFSTNPSLNDVSNTVAFMAFANSLELSQKQQLVEFYYRSVFRYQIEPTPTEIPADSTDDFGLVEEQILPVLEDIISENATVDTGESGNCEAVTTRILNLPLSAKKIVLLIKKMIALSTISQSFHILLQLSKNIKLEPIHKLEIFLYACQHERELFQGLEVFNVLTSNDPAIKILGAWKNVFLEEQVQTLKVETEDNEPVRLSNASPEPRRELSVTDIEEDDEIVATRIKTYTLPALKRLSETYFPDPTIDQKHACESDAPRTSFIQSTLQNLLTYKEDAESTLPLINMTVWFSWACARILMEPKLRELCHESPDNKNPANQIATSKKRGNKKLDVTRTFNNVLKEILNFASPKLRYALSAFFFEDACLDDKKRYFSLVEGCSLDALLPTLALCKILSQEQDAVEQEKCVTEIKTLLEEVSFSTYYGRHFRSLVSAILATSEDTTTEPLLRLQLINKILIKSNEKFIEALNYFKLDEKQAIELTKLELKKQTLSREIGRLTYKVAESEERSAQILTLETGLAAVNARVKGIYDESHISFGKTEIDKLWEDLKQEFESEILEKIKAYLPKGRLSKTDFHTFQRRALDDLNLFYKTRDFNQRTSHLIMLQGLAMLGQLADFRGLEQHNFTRQARAVLKKLFALSESEILLYNSAFSKCHNEASLLTYFSKIKTLKEEAADQLMSLFKDFIKQVLSDNSSEFYAQRYNRADNQHLTTIFSGRDALKADWIKGESCDLATFVKDHNLTFKPYEPNFREFLEKKIFGHQHVDPNFYGLLKQYLNASNDDERQQRRAAAQELMSQFQGGNTTAGNSKKQHAIVQYECIQLLEVSRVESKSYAEPLKILSRMRKALESQNNTVNQFKHDIDGLVKGLKSARKTPSVQDWTGWKIVDTDHFWSLFMAGTDVEGSCQSVDGNPDLNKCLMAYVMDGKNRMLAIQNADGVTVARCILRLLWDSQNNVPVLFLEEIYPETIRRDLYEALVRFAIIRAQKLNVTLVTLESTDASYQYEGEIIGLGNTFVPWEYVDATYGKEQYGNIKIPSAQILFRAELKNDLAFQKINLETKQDDFVFHLGELQKALSPRSVSANTLLNQEEGDVPRLLAPMRNNMNVIASSSHFGITQGQNTREYLCARGSAEP